MTDDERANLLVQMANGYNHRTTLAAIEPLQRAYIEELHSAGVLSVAALAAIFGVNASRVLAIVGRDSARARGKLNPQHIAWLAYALSLKKITPEDLRMMLSGGTSISTIEDLTGISRATLNRWRKQ